MRRPVHALVLCLCALAALAPTASAKELRAAKVCGADACAQVPREDLSHRLLESGGVTSAPAEAEPWYRVRFVIAGGGHSARFELKLLPRSRYAGAPEDGIGSSYFWHRVDRRTAAVYQRLASGLEPLPASRLEAILAADQEKFEPDASAPLRPPEPTSTEQDGENGVAIAGVVAAVGVLALAGWSLRRGASRRA